jgi:hypothetical protein
MTNTEYFKSTQINSETSSTSGETSLFSKTLIIFDFDDTLFCTKYFDTFALSYQDIFACKVSLEEINPCLVRELKQLESTIIELFINLQQNYDIIIISNADLKWINNCLTHFLSELKEHINENDIKIYSAKNMFSKIVKNSKEWKSKCFKKVINDLYKNDLNSDLNVISIGDSKEEKKAVFNLTKIHEFRKIHPKFIHMISFPSAASIILQLKYLNDNINNMIIDNNTIFKLNIQVQNDGVEIICILPKKKENEEMCINYLNENDSVKINNSLYLNKCKKFINEDYNYDYTCNE